MRVVCVGALLATVGCDQALDLVAVKDPSGDARGDANAVTVTFGETGAETYAGVTSDTWLEQEFPTVSHGAGSTLSCDGGSSAPRVALIRFDVSAIPATATVVGASLSLNTVGETASTIKATQMLEAWDEGLFDGTPGVPNWTQRTVAGAAWTMPGAAPPSRGTAVIGTVFPVAIDTTYELVLEVPVVAGWVADPATNFGIALIVDTSDGVSFRSRNNGDADRRPVLHVTFVPP